MEKKVFREYMHQELIQKTIIFADVFGLSIDRWESAREYSKFPYRIHLYEKNNIVGYIDAEVKDFGYIEKYPIVLYTPIGNIIGSYKDWLFDYHIEKPNSDVITEMKGFFGIEREIPQDHYEVKAYLSFKDNAEDSYLVSFNDCVGCGTLRISKNQGLDDLFFYINRNLSISHRTNLVGGNYKDINDAYVTMNTSSTVLGKFEFNGILPYEEDMTIENANDGRQRVDTLIDLEKLHAEILNHDPRIFELMEEVRGLLSIPSRKGTLSIYDKLTFHCFHNDGNRIKTSLINNMRVSEKLTKNPVLQKMATYNKRNFY